jgi:hypothetical protein
VWCVTGSSLGAAQEELPRVTAASAASIAYWCGDLDFVDEGRVVDEIWAPTRFLRENLTVPPGGSVVLAPTLLDPSPVCAPSTRADFGLPDDAFVFLVRLDLLDSMERQNVAGVLAAFRAAFPHPGAARLLVRTRHGRHRSHAFDQLAWSVRDRPDIRVWDADIDEAHDNALLATSDCLVSLHRVVGVGLDIAVAMALGRATIATAYSGNLDFCTEQTTELVPFRSVPVSDPGYLAEGDWAEPDLDAAARAMAGLVSDPPRARRMGEAARQRVAEVHQPQAFVEFARRRLGEGRARPDRPALPRVPQGPVNPAAADPTEGSAEMAVQLPPVESVLRYGRDAGPLRRLVRRVVFALTKNNLYYSRSLVEAALQQLGVATGPVHRVVSGSQPGVVPPDRSASSDSDG